MPVSAVVADFASAVPEIIGERVRKSIKTEIADLLRRKNAFDDDEFQTKITQAAFRGVYDIQTSINQQMMTAWADFTKERVIKGGEIDSSETGSGFSVEKSELNSASTASSKS